MMRDRKHDHAMAELLRDDPELAVGLLQEIRLVGDAAELQTLVRQFVLAFGADWHCLTEGERALLKGPSPPCS